METKDVLLRLRTEKKITQDELAEKVFVTRQAVSRWEKGETTPNVENMKQDYVLSIAILLLAGFWSGILFLLLLDHVIPHLHRNSEKAEGPRSKLQRDTMLLLAVTLHNIPEGMAVYRVRNIREAIETAL